MQRKSKISSHRKYRKRVKPGKKNSKYIDWALVSISVLVVIMISSTAVKFVQGEAESLPPEISILRTQIANGCGIAGAANNYAEWLKFQNDALLKFDIIDVTNHESPAIPKTMVLLRDPLAKPKANMIAAKLGIDRDKVIFRELEDNFLSLDITVVIGNDYKQLEFHPATLKTEILNGCGIKGIAKKFSVYLGQMENPAFKFEIGEEGNFNSFDVDESLLIIKSDRAREHSINLAKALDIKQNNIIKDSPGKSDSDADIAIVVGKDWGRKLSTN